MTASTEDETRVENKMWGILTSDCTAIEPMKMSSLLLLHGLASEEYLSFCDDVLLDTLSSSLKPAPRRMFQYYRSNLWQPCKSDCDVINSKTSTEPKADNIEDHVHSPVIKRSGQSLLGILKEYHTEDGMHALECLECDESITQCEKFKDRSRVLSSTALAANTPSNSDMADVDLKLSDFCADSRIASYECSDELALSYLKIFEDDVESAVTAFLESGPVRKPVPRHEEQTGDSHWEQVQSSLQCQKVNSDPLQVQQLSLPLGKAHGDREKPHEASTQHVTADRSLEERQQQQQQRTSQQPRVESKPEDISVTETVQNNFKFDCTVEPSGRQPGQTKKMGAASAFSSSSASFSVASATGSGSRSVRSGSGSGPGSDVVRGSGSGSGAVSSPATKNEEVFVKLQQFLDCKRAIEQTWSGISSGQLERVPAVDTVQLPDMSWNFALRQQNLQGSPVDSMDELNEAAAAANPIFESCIRRLLAAADLPAAFLHMAPLKGRVRASEKAKDDYDEREPGHGERWLFDIVRGAVLCETEEQLARMIAALQRSSEIEIVRLKNRFANPTPAGFRDFNLNIRMAVQAYHTRHICELQVHCAAIKMMDEVKLSHKIYEYFRTYFRGEAKSVDDRLRALEQVAGSLGTEGATLEAIVESALTSNDLSQLLNVNALLDLLVEYKHRVGILRAIVQFMEGQIGPEHPAALTKVNDLAKTLQTIGKMSEARALFQRALRGHEKACGPEHRQTLAVLNNFADLLKTVGENKRARCMYERVLLGWQKSKGRDQLNALITMNNLGGVLQALGEMEEARALMNAALKGQEHYFDPEHSETIKTLSNLGGLLFTVGEIVEARPVIERALRGSEKIWGPQHPQTQGQLNNFAAVLKTLGEKAEARVVFERVLRGYENAYGPEHPETLIIVNNLGGTLIDLGELFEGRSMFERALLGWEKAFGPNHTHTWLATSNLASSLKLLGEREQSRSLYERALRGLEKSAGSQHPYTVLALKGLQALDEKRDHENIKIEPKDDCDGQTNTASTADIPGKAEMADAVKLSLFFGDSRVASYECSDELALSYLEIFEDDVESAVSAFLESGPVEIQEKPVPQSQEQTDDNCRKMVQSLQLLQKGNSDPPQGQQLSPPLGEAHPDRERPHEASAQHVTAHRSLEERQQQQQHTTSQQPRVESKLEDKFVAETLQKNFKFDCTVEPSGRQPGYSKKIPIEEMETQAEEKKVMANAAMANKEYDEAIRCYSEALELSATGPNSHIYYSNRAAAHCFLKKYERAVEDCEAAIRLRADFAKAYSRLGLCNFYLGRYEASVAAYERVMELEPDNRANVEELMKAKGRLHLSGRPGSTSNSFSGSPTTKNEEVFVKLQQFLDCKRAIEQTWAGISSGQLERVPAVDTAQLPDMSWNFALRQQNLQGSPVDSMDELYEAAAAANPIFESCIGRILAAADLPAAFLHMAPLKGRVRASEKAKDDYDEREPGHGERWLFDIVRGAVLCETEEQLACMIAALQRSSEIEIVRLKNRFANPTPAGFRDFNLNIRMAVQAHHTHHICELQVHCAAIKMMDEVKLSHKIYEYFRTYFRGEAKSVDDRLRALEQVAGSLGTEGATLEAIVNSALELNDLSQLLTVRALLELPFEYEHNIRVLRQILLTVESQKGPEHPDTLAKAVELASLLNGVLETTESRALYERALTGFEKTFGPEHPNTLTTANYLAGLLSDLGETANARALYERALRGLKKALGPEHIETLRTVNNLAVLLRVLGEFVEARALFQRSLRGYERVCGPEHPETLATVKNLGLALNDLGATREAQTLIERALRGQERALGPEHSETLGTVNNLAIALDDQGEKEQARGLYERALRGYEKIWGPEHHETLRVVNNLAILLKSLGERVKARSLYERALRGKEKALGPEHHETLNTVNNLAVLLVDLGETGKARALYERALRGREKALGPEHPETLGTMNNLANLLSDRGDKSNARRLYERALRGMEKAFGPTHSHTLMTALSLGLELKELGESNLAVPVSQTQDVCMHILYTEVI